MFINYALASVTIIKFTLKFDFTKQNSQAICAYYISFIDSEEMKNISQNETKIHFFKLATKYISFIRLFWMHNGGRLSQDESNFMTFVWAHPQSLHQRNGHICFIYISF